MSQSEQDGPQKPARNMADIARLFLDGARPASPGATPRRLAPQHREGPRAQPAPSTTARASQPAPIGASWEMPDVLLALAGTKADGWKSLSSMAAGIAEEQSTTVGIVSIQDGRALIAVAGAEAADDLPRIAPGAGSPDMQIARALFTLRESVAHWLIGAPEAASSAFAKLAAGIAEWAVVCPASNDGVVAAYQHVKRAIGITRPSQSLHCFMLSDDYAEAAVVHGRLRTATQEFLRRELPLAGVAPVTSPALPLLGIAVREDQHEQVWSAVLDELLGLVVDEANEADEAEETLAAGPVEMGIPVQENLDVDLALEKVAAASAAVDAYSSDASAVSRAVFDQLTHVLDPEERAALGADLPGHEEEEPPAALADESPASPSALPDYDIRRAVTLQPPPPAPAAPAPTLTPLSSKDSSSAVTLRAFDLLDAEERERATQWQAVERSIRDLVGGSVTLEARPPISWAAECCIAVDPAGDLHVWTLYKDGVSWFALREWAMEHRNLLALTRRDLAINKEGEVAVHIVLPLEGGSDSRSDIQSLLRNPSRNVFVYRLRAISWNARRGILVVPIA